MRTRNLLALMLAFAAASCSENAPPPAQTNAAAAPMVAGPDHQPIAQAQVKPYQPPVPPPDAQWTILCDTIKGPTHVTEAEITKDRLIKASGAASWYVIHSETESSIYYGYYRSLDDPGEKRRADADRARIASLADRVGNPLVRGGLLVPVNMPDPAAPADWNLLNTPRDAYWTIEIATFAGNVKRKEAAVEEVRELRAAGETQAYFYHGPTASSVCIGAWKREAVAEQGTGIGRGGNSRDDAHTESADTPLLVLNDVAPPNMPSRVYDPNTGKAMAVEARKLDVLDPDMKKKMETEKYKYHTVNYEYRGVSNQGQTFPDPSVLVVIPHDAHAAGDDDWRLNGAAAPAPGEPTVTAPRSTPSSAGDSVLRSIGDH